MIVILLAFVLFGSLDGSENIEKNGKLFHILKSNFLENDKLMFMIIYF